MRETPASLGYRWPAEWEPHAATWLSWPHNLETWPGRLERAVEAFVVMVRALHEHEEVCINVGSEALEESARGALSEGGVDPDHSVRFFRIETDDAWVRDHGPIFLVRDRDGAREHALVDFRYDAWGGKYPPWDRDADVTRQMAEALGVTRFECDLVLEGGSIEGNGDATLLTTEQCLLHPNRGEGRTRESIEGALHDWLGIEHTIWLRGGIEGDDTDGHIDDVARFVNANTVVTIVPDDASHPDSEVLAENLRRLREARDRHGKPLDIVTLPVPPPIKADGALCPASYANFYLANGVALVPTFGTDTDARALATLDELLVDREIVGIPARDLVIGLGAVHCLTQQQPA